MYVSEWEREIEKREISFSSFMVSLLGIKKKLQSNMESWTNKLQKSFHDGTFVGTKVRWEKEES